MLRLLEMMLWLVIEVCMVWRTNLSHSLASRRDGTPHTALESTQPGGLPGLPGMWQTVL